MDAGRRIEAVSVDAVEGAAELITACVVGGGGVCMTCGGFSAMRTTGNASWVDIGVDCHEGRAGTGGAGAAAGGQSGGLSAMVPVFFDKFSTP